MIKMPKEFETAMKTGLPADRAKAIDAIAALALSELALMTKDRKPLKKRLRFKPFY